MSALGVAAAPGTPFAMVGSCQRSGFRARGRQTQHQNVSGDIPQLNRRPRTFWGELRCELDSLPEPEPDLAELVAVAAIAVIAGRCQRASSLWRLRTRCAAHRPTEWPGGAGHYTAPSGPASGRAAVIVYRCVRQPDHRAGRLLRACGGCAAAVVAMAAAMVGAMRWRADLRRPRSRFGMPMGAGGTDPPIGYDLMNDVGHGRRRRRSARAALLRHPRRSRVHATRQNVRARYRIHVAQRGQHRSCCRRANWISTTRAGFRIIGRYDICPLAVVEFGYMGIFD